MIEDHSRANAASIGAAPDSKYARMSRSKPVYNGAGKARDYLHHSLRSGTEVNNRCFRGVTCWRRQPSVGRRRLRQEEPRTLYQEHWRYRFAVSRSVQSSQFRRCLPLRLDFPHAAIDGCPAPERDRGYHRKIPQEQAGSHAGVTGPPVHVAESNMLPPPTWAGRLP
jgi:hypothetical protein